MLVVVVLEFPVLVLTTTRSASCLNVTGMECNTNLDRIDKLLQDRGL